MKSRSDDLGDDTERLLERSALDALAITGKAGQVVAGFGKVEDAHLEAARRSRCPRREAPKTASASSRAALRRKQPEKRGKSL